jgi:hypothetical protein
MFCVSLTNLITLSNVEYNRTILLGKKKKELLLVAMFVGQVEPYEEVL